MTRKKLTNSPSGTSTMFGGEDINYIQDLWTGVDQSSADPVPMNTLWTYRPSKLQIANSGYNGTSNANAYTIGSSAITANRIATIPTISADRGFVLANAVQALTNKTIIRSSTNASDTNLYPDAFVMPNLGKRKTTTYFGGTGSNNFGFGFGQTAGFGATATFTTTAGIGRYSTFASTATPNTQGGMRADTAGTIAVCRALKTRFVCKFRLPQTNSCRFWCGLVATVAAPVIGTAPLDTPLEGYMIGYRSDTSDTNFKIARNDNSGTTTITDTGVAVTANTLYKLEIRAPAGDDRFQTSINGSTFTSNEHTTDIPASTTAIYPQIHIETLESVAKSLHCFYWYLEIIDP